MRVLPLPQEMTFYQLPVHAHFYPELVNSLGAGADAANTVEHATVRLRMIAYAASRVGSREQRNEMLAAYLHHHCVLPLILHLQVG